MKHVTKEFVTAGKAIFTIETPTGHFTFRVNRKKANGNWPDAFFVKILTGPENTSDYTYLGKLSPDTGKVYTTKASSFSEGTYVVRLLNRVLARVWADEHEAYESHGYKTHHEGKCGRCGRLLTVPTSIESGIGPECAKIMGG